MSVSSLGRYVFGSEISYNKPPPRLPGLAYLIAQSCKNSWDIDFQKFLDCDIFLNLKNLKFSKI